MRPMLSLAGGGDDTMSRIYTCEALVHDKTGLMVRDCQASPKTSRAGRQLCSQHTRQFDKWEANRPEHPGAGLRNARVVWLWKDAT